MLYQRSSFSASLRLGATILAVFGVLAALMIVSSLVSVGIKSREWTQPAPTDVTLKAYASSTLNAFACLAEPACSEREESLQYLRGSQHCRPHLLLHARLRGGGQSFSYTSRVQPR